MPITLQELVGAAERLERRERDGGARDDWLARVEEARDRLAQTPFEPLALNAFVVKSGDKERLVASPQNPDRLIQEALSARLQRVIEPHLGDGVHGYRRGRSATTAAWAAAQAVAKGRRFIAQVDVRDFFLSVDLNRLGPILSDLAGEEDATLALAFVRAPRRLGERLIPPETGLPVGLPISPLLANLYLAPLDHDIEAAIVTFLRYSDDLFLAAETAALRDAAVCVLQNRLHEMGLKLAEEKSEVFEVADEPFIYLGHAVGAGVVYEKLSGDRERKVATAGINLAAPPAVVGPKAIDRRGSRSLYLTEPGSFLCSREGAAIIRKGKETLREIPFRRIDRIVVLAGMSMTSGFVEACVDREIPIFFLSRPCVPTWLRHRPSF